jgi:hypothetical protein
MGSNRPRHVSMNICPYGGKWGINLRRPTQIYGTKVGEHYEYVARFVDDVISFSRIQCHHEGPWKAPYYEGVGKPQYYLGGDVVELGEEWNKEGIYTAFSAETYIKK